MLPNGAARSQYTDGNGQGRTRGVDARQRPSPSQPKSSPSQLPQHAHQIMDTILWNQGNRATQHGRRLHEEEQIRLISNLRRQAQQSVGGRQQYDAQSFWGPPPTQLEPAKKNTAPPPPQTRKAAANRAKDGTDSISHQVMTTPSTMYEPLNTHNNHSYDDDEDIVCCDTGGRCHEGTKNLCTITLWAFMVFAILNRFFVHMAMHLSSNNESVSPKQPYVRVVDAPADPNGENTLVD